MSKYASQCMKSLLCILLGLAVSQTTFAQSPTDSVYSVNIVGFQKLEIPEGLTQGSTPFLADADYIQDLVGDQLTGGGNFNSADNILKWDANAQTYQLYFLIDGTGNPAFDGKWFRTSPAPAGFATTDIDRVSPGDTIWFRNRVADSTQTVVFVGDVVMDATVTNSIIPGLQLISYPYSASIVLNDFDFHGDGAQGGGNFNVSDNILKWDEETQSYALYFLIDGTGNPAFDGNWFRTSPAPAGFATNDIIQPGEGFWYRHRGSGFNWTEDKPY